MDIFLGPFLLQTSVFAFFFSFPFERYNSSEKILTIWRVSFRRLLPTIYNLKSFLFPLTHLLVLAKALSRLVNFKQSVICFIYFCCWFYLSDLVQLSYGILSCPCQHSYRKDVFLLSSLFLSFIVGCLPGCVTITS